METLSWRGVLAQLFLNSIPCWHNKELLHCKGTTVCKHLALMNNCQLKVESTLKNVDRCLLTCFLMSYEHSTKMILIHFITFETILTITHKLCESNHTPHRMKIIIYYFWSINFWITYCDMISNWVFVSRPSCRRWPSHKRREVWQNRPPAAGHCGHSYRISRHYQHSLLWVLPFDLP